MPKGYPGSSLKCLVDDCNENSRARGLCHKHWCREYDKGRKNQRRDRLYKTKYKINLEEYNKIFEEQKGLCKICGVHQSEFKYRLAVDHDHKCCPKSEYSCGKCIRGLLCNTCNVTVGKIESNPQLFGKIINYIKENSYA